MELECFLCSQKIANGADGLAKHLSRGHGISVSGRLENEHFICGYGDCRQSYAQFYNLRRHMKSEHEATNHPPYPDDNAIYFDDHDKLVPDIKIEEQENDEEQEHVEEQKNVEEHLGESVNNNKIFDGSVEDLRADVIKMIWQFNANPAITGEIITTVLIENEQFLRKYNTFLRNKVITELQKSNIDETVIKNVSDSLNFNSPFEGFFKSETESTPNKRKNTDLFFSEQSNYLGSSPKLLRFSHGQQNHDSQTSSEASSSKVKEVDKNQFSRYHTIRETLENHSQGPNVLKALKNGCFTEKERRQLVKIIVAELVQIQTAYPPHEAKMSMCESLVTEFPQLRNGNTTFGYEHFYNPNTKLGFVHYKLQEHQKNLPKSEKKYNKKTFRTNDLPSRKNIPITLLKEEELNEKISLMKHTNPSLQNKEELSKCMSETFYNRRNWILQHNPTVYQVIELYPCLACYDGYMIDLEFDKMHEGKENSFRIKFPTEYKSKILKYARFANPKLLEKHKNEKNEDMKALLILIDLLPVPNSLLYPKSKKISSTKEKDAHFDGKVKGLGKGKCNINCAQDCFLQNSTDSIDIEAYIRDNGKSKTNNMQPHLLRTGNFIFVIADNVFFARTDAKDVIAAFDLLFKVYHVFNLDYPVHLRYFYEFVESYIYKCRTYSTQTIVSLHTNLANVNTELLDENVAPPLGNDYSSD